MSQIGRLEQTMIANFTHPENAKLKCKAAECRNLAPPQT